MKNQRRELTRTLFAAAVGAAALSEKATAQTCTALCYPLTTQESSAGVTPTNYAYPPGYPRRYGALGNGTTNDTAALTTCISCNSTVTFTEGDIYGVTSIVFPWHGPNKIDFNGALLRGIATSATSAVMVIQCGETNFHDVLIDLYSATSTPNTNYTCAIWWYNASKSSQWVNIFGLYIRYAVRGVVYGPLPPNAPDNSVLQSENKVYGFQTLGVQNPFYSNVGSGSVHFADPIFYSGADGWTTPDNYNPSVARALEINAGNVFAQGGEIELGGYTTGYAANLQNCYLVGMNIEIACPLQIMGDNVQIIGGLIFGNIAGFSAIHINAEATGLLKIVGTRFARSSGGAYDESALINGTAAPTFEIDLSDTASNEWRWGMNGGTDNVRLVSGCVVRYQNHRMSITASDPNIYILRTFPGDSLLDGSSFDRLGYTTSGWTTSVQSGSFIATVSGLAGPTGYQSAQLEAGTGGGYGYLYSANVSTLANLQATAIRVAPRDLYWASAWIKNVSGGTVKFVASFFNLSGTQLTDQLICDQNYLTDGSWVYAEGPVPVPTAAAYMAIGIYVGANLAAITDLRVRRAN